MGENAVGDFFLCGGRGGSCCGNACAAVGSKCCKVGEFAEWYPVSNETECREGGDSASQNEARNPKPDFWSEAVSWGDLCCENAVGNFFLCGGQVCGCVGVWVCGCVCGCGCVCVCVGVGVGVGRGVDVDVDVGVGLGVGVGAGMCVCMCVYVCMCVCVCV